MQLTAKQYGAMLRLQGARWPVPRIGRADMLQPGVTVHRIGRREPGNAVLLLRNGWGTVYVAKAFGGYAATFDEVVPRPRLMTEVDHLFPKSRALPGDMLALGRIARGSNRSIRDGEDAVALSNKLLEAMRRSPHMFASQLTDMERGWGVVCGYLRPLAELRGYDPQPLSRAEVEATFPR